MNMEKEKARKIDFCTDYEKERAKRHAAIRRDFLALRMAYPDVKDARLLKVVASEYGVTPNTVRNIVKEAKS